MFPGQKTFLVGFSWVDQHLHHPGAWPWYTRRTSRAAGSNSSPRVRNSRLSPAPAPLPRCRRREGRPSPSGASIPLGACATRRDWANVTADRKKRPQEHPCASAEGVLPQRGVARWEKSRNLSFHRCAISCSGFPTRPYEGVVVVSQTGPFVVRVRWARGAYLPIFTPVDGANRSTKTEPTVRSSNWPRYHLWDPTCNVYPTPPRAR